MKFLLPLLLAASLYAEATFDQVQSMINNHQYKQAVLALTIIDTNHPNSSKVQYTLAQAHAGLGNLSTAQDHFLKAKALNPKLDFAPSDAVTSLEQAIMPQTKLIKPVTTGPSWWEYLLAILSFGLVFWLWKLRSRRLVVITPTKPAPSPAYRPSYTRPIVVPDPTYSTPVPNAASMDDLMRKARDDNSTYTAGRPYYSTPVHTEHHHHHTSDSGLGVVGTVAVTGLTAAAVSTVLNDDRPSTSTHSYQPESISTYWEDEPTRFADEASSTISSSWDDDTSSSRSSSWSDSSSSSSSWDSSSSSSSD